MICFDLKNLSYLVKTLFFDSTTGSGEASPKIWSCYANFSVFIDYKRNQFLKK